MKIAEDKRESIRRLISREYKIFLEEERLASLRRTIYEKACNKAEKILKVKPDKKAGQTLRDAINFTHLRATPEGVMSLTFLAMLIILIPTVLFILLKFIGLPGISFGYGMMIIIVGMIFVFYLYHYPIRLKSVYEMAVGSDIVTFILYAVMYMRNTPNLEGAIRFAAESISGPIGFELKKLLWDVEVGNYLSMEDALLDYSKKWSGNRPFVESIQLLITSLRQVGDKRLSMLEEAINIVLDGSREDAKHFNQKLKLPVTVIHALGIILPVMGLVMFPIVAVFLNVDASLLFIGYDIILPFVLYFIITNTLRLRPATFSTIDIRENPDMPPEGRFRWGKKFVRAWPISFLIGGAIVAAGLALYISEISAAKKDFEGIIPAIVITLGVALGFGIYFILISNQRLKVRADTRKIEEEFAEALFQLGNQISGGKPLELSMDNMMERIKNLKIKDFFGRALNNMKLLGFTFSKAFFDENYGAVKYYPSKLIKSVMKAVIESSRKGVTIASNAMLSVSRYLKDLHTTQEEIKESLNDTLGSLKFQAFFLTPMISGTVATLAIIIIRILKQLGEQAPSFGGGVPMLAQFQNINITPFQFIMVVSIYMIETSFILAMFINAIENGEDPIGRQNTTGYTLIIGFVVFAACLLLTLTLFSPLISAVV